MTEAPLEHRRSTRPPIREVTPTGILRWLRLGFRDLFKAGWPSLAHGLIVTAISLVIIGITFLFWPLLPGAVSGFLVVGPVLAAGLYALSYRIEQGEPARFRDAVNAWRCGSRCLLRFGLLLVGIGTAWVLLSVVLFHFFVHAEIDGPMDFLRSVDDCLKPTGAETIDGLGGDARWPLGDEDGVACDVQTLRALWHRAADEDIVDGFRLEARNTPDGLISLTVINVNTIP